MLLDVVAIVPSSVVSVVSIVGLLGDIQVRRIPRVTVFSCRCLFVSLVF